MKNKPIIDAGKSSNYVKENTEDILNKKYRNDIGHNAVVQRETIENHTTDALKEVLKDMGKDAQTLKIIPQGMQYKGSVAVHIYTAPTTGMVSYFSQIALSECPEPLAGPAVSDLRGSMLEYYNRSRQKKRSGF